MRLRERLALLALGGTVLLVSLVATATASRTIELTLRRQLGGLLRAPADLGSVEFSFLDGLVVRDFHVYDPLDPLGPPLVAVGRAEVQYELDLGGRGPHITRIWLRDPTVRLHVDADGRVDLADVLRLPEPDPDPDAPPAQVPSILVEGGTLEVTHAGLLSQATTLSDILASVEQIEPGRLAVEVRGTSDLLGPVHAKATTGDPARGHVELERLELRPELATRFEGPAAELLQQLEPRGTATVRVESDLTGGRLELLSGELHLVDASLLLPLPGAAEQDPPAPLPLTDVAAELALDTDGLAVRFLSAAVLDGRLDLTGSVADWEDGGTPEVHVRGGWTGLHLDEAAAAHVPASVARVLHAFRPWGRFDLDELRFDLVDGEPDVAVVLRPQGGDIEYVGYVQEETGRRLGFAYPATDVRGELRVEGVVIELDLRARHDDVLVEAQGTIDYLQDGVEHLDIVIAARDVPLDQDLRAAFQDRADRLFDRWDPEGVAAGVRVHLRSDPPVDHGHTVTEVHLELDERASFRPREFPTRFRTGTGEVHVTYPLQDGERVELVELPSLPVQGDGFELTADVTSLAGELEIRARGRADAVERGLVPGVLASPKLGEPVKEFLRTTQPTGATRLDVTIAPGRDRVELHTEGMAVVALPRMPLPVSEIHGHVVVDDEAVVLDDVRGRALGAEVAADGRIADGVRLHVRGVGLPLDERLRSRLGDYAEPAAVFFDTLRPGDGTRADVDLRVEPDDSLRLELRELRGPIAPQGVALDVLRGSLLYETERVTAELDATFPGSEGELGLRDLVADTRTGDLSLALAARRMRFPRDLTGLLDEQAVASIEEQLPDRWTHVRGLPESEDPEHLRLRWLDAEQRLTLDGVVDLRPSREDQGQSLGLAPRGALEFRDVEFNFVPGGPLSVDGRFRTSSFDIDPGLAVSDVRADAVLGGLVDASGWLLWLDAVDAELTILDQRLTDASFVLEYDHERLRVRDLDAELFRGRLTGKVGHNPRMAYAGKLALRSAALEAALGDDATSELTGRLDGRVQFRNRSGDTGDLHGGGELTVQDARLGFFPPVFRLTKVLGAVAPLPESEPDDAARIEFDLAGPWAKVRSLTLESDGLDLRDGDGRVSLDDGRLDLTVYPLVNVSVLPVGLLERLLKELQRLPQALDVHTAHVGGTLRNPEVSYRVLPGAAEEGEDLLPQPMDPRDVDEEYPW